MRDLIPMLAAIGFLFGTYALLLCAAAGKKTPKR